MICFTTIGFFMKLNNFEVFEIIGLQVARTQTFPIFLI